MSAICITDRFTDGQPPTARHAAINFFLKSVVYECQSDLPGKLGHLFVGALLRYDGGQSQTTEQVSNQANGHAEQLLPMLDHLLNSAGLDRADISGIVFGQGPGGFTGLRIAAGMAQGLGLGLDIPVFPVSSLLAVAETVRPVAPLR